MVKYIDNPDYKHASPAQTGILLANLGTPDEPTPAALRRYLAEFLSDQRVIELPRLVWWLVLHGIILNTRPKRSAKLYAKIWTENGSPLLDISKRQAKAIQEQLHKQIPGPVIIDVAMRYGNPSIAAVLEKMRQANVQRLLVLPLYPQYSATTTASTFDAVTKVLKSWRWIPELRMINHYHDDDGYIEAITESIRNHWASHNKPTKLLFSFHGLPQHYFLAGDPYFCECQKTARLVAEQLGLQDDDWQVSFQSRFGPREWLQPYTDKILKQWGEAGLDSVDVICPGFAADCLETLEEIKIQNQATFLKAGGKRFCYIPALNDQPLHISVLTDLIVKHCQGWPEFSENWNKEKTEKELQLKEEKSNKLKKSAMGGNTAKLLRR